MMEQNLLEIAVIIILFVLIIGLLFYVLKTSGQREHRLIALLEIYAVQLQNIVRDISEISRRLERMEYRSQGFNVTQIGEKAHVGQTASGSDIQQKKE